MSTEERESKIRALEDQLAALKRMRASALRRAQGELGPGLTGRAALQQRRDVPTAR